MHYYIWNRTLTPVDNFSDNTKVSLNIKDCEAPESLKILIGMELDTWQWHWTLMVFLGSWGGVSSLTSYRGNGLEIKPLGLGSTLFCFWATLHFSKLFESGDLLPAIVTCWWPDELTWIKTVLSWPWEACMVVSSIHSASFCGFQSHPGTEGGRTLPDGVWSWQGFSMKFTSWLNENSIANCAASSNVPAFWSLMNVRTPLWMHHLNSSIKTSCLIYIHTYVHTYICLLWLPTWAFQLQSLTTIFKIHIS